MLFLILRSLQVRRNVYSNFYFLLFTVLLFIISLFTFYYYPYSLSIVCNSKYNLNPIYSILFLKIYGKLIQNILNLRLWGSGAGHGLG